MPRTPRIALTARRTPVDRPYPLLESVALQATYPDAVTRAGGLAVLLAPAEIDRDAADAILDEVEGLVVTGGDDVDPRRYGEEPHESVTHVDELQDHFEAALLDAALARSMPVLCICRGTQLLNIERGGSLFQHIVGMPGIAAHGIPFGGGGTLNDVTVDGDSTLAAVLGATTARGECHHHQAIDRLGEGVRVVARAADGTVEGIELTSHDGWLVAVQWHPEDTAGTDPQQQLLFDELVRQAGRPSG